jgi:hypothetical protein
MQKVFESQINGNEFKIVEYYDEHFYHNLEPSIGTTPSRKTTTTIIYKNNEFWGKCVSNTYHGNWEAKQKPEAETRYELTVGDEKNFNKVVFAIRQNYGL